MKFQVEGVLSVQERDGKRFARIDYMGGSVSVLLGREFRVPVGEGVMRFNGAVRFGKTGAYFILENAE